jgi:hypothetical protein
MSIVGKVKDETNLLMLDLARHLGDAQCCTARTGYLMRVWIGKVKKDGLKRH